MWLLGCGTAFLFISMGQKETSGTSDMVSLSWELFFCL